MQWNLKLIRDAVFEQADWAPQQSSTAQARVDKYINRALDRICLEAPFLFFEDTVHLATMADHEPTLSDDKLSVVSTDAYVLETESATADIWADHETHPWDGRAIEIKDSDGVWHRRRIRTIWRVEKTVKFRCSLDRPWINLTDTGLEYRIFNDAYHMPPDVIELRNIYLDKANQGYPLDIISAEEAESLTLHDRPEVVTTGQPRVAWRSGHFQIPAPQVAPDAARTAGTPLWGGPELPGEFSYAYTYCWGYRDAEFGSLTPDTHGSDGHLAEPLWESAPSPISSTVNTAPDQGSNQHIKLTFPDIDFMQGFGASAEARSGRSGWRIRIYRRRHSQATGAGHTDDPVKQENSEAYYLLTEITPQDNSTTKNWPTFLDTGVITPDYHRRLKHFSGTEMIRFYPRPDARYEVDIRCIRRPEPLTADYDSPTIHPEAIDALVQKALSYLYQAEGDYAGKRSAEEAYATAIYTWRKRYGDLRPDAKPAYKRLARAHSSTRGRGRYRRWW